MWDYASRLVPHSLTIKPTRWRSADSRIVKMTSVFSRSIAYIFLFYDFIIFALALALPVCARCASNRIVSGAHSAHVQTTSACFNCIFFLSGLRNPPIQHLLCLHTTPGLRHAGVHTSNLFNGDGTANNDNWNVQFFALSFAVFLSVCVGNLHFESTISRCRALILSAMCRQRCQRKHLNKWARKRTEKKKKKNNILTNCVLLSNETNLFRKRGISVKSRLPKITWII